ncbi:MAG: two-component regulator propeller domain-containing protein [Acidobacteriota bacterium]
MSRCVFILILIIVTVFRGQAVHAARLPVRVFTTNDGLAQDSVNCIMEDSHGYLWFCTGEGLSRFDGYQFKSYGSGEGSGTLSVTGIAESVDGRYWIVTARDGVFCLETSLGRLAGTGSIPAGDGGNRPSATRLVKVPGADSAGGYGSSICVDRRGVVWCGNSGGLYRLEEAGGRRRFQPFDAGIVPVADTGGRGPECMTLDGEGQLWLGAPSGLYRLKPGGGSGRYSTANGLPWDGVSCVLEDRNGHLWIGSLLGLCSGVVDETTGRLSIERTYTTRDGLATDKVTSLCETSDGRIWVGTTEGIAVHLENASAGGPCFRSFGREHGLSDTSIRALAEDGCGNLWVGTESCGATRIELQGLVSYGESDGLGASRIKSIIQTRSGELCAVGGNFFLNRYDGDGFHAVRPDVLGRLPYLGWGWHQIVVQDHLGEWWFPSGEGLYRFPAVDRVDDLARCAPIAVYTMREGLGGEDVFRLFEDSRGDLWISCITKLVAVLTRWERSTGIFHRYQTTDGVPFSAPTAFCEDRHGSLWIGFYDGGVARYCDGKFTFFTSSDGIPAGFVWCLLTDHVGRLWVGGDRGGLGRIDDPTAWRPSVVRYTLDQGLASNAARAITEDRWGRIYVGSGRGLDCLDPKTGSVRHYTTADGLANNAVSTLFCDHDGRIWAGTLQGLSVLDPSPPSPESPPECLITGIRIGGIPHPICDLGEPSVSGIRTQSSDFQIEFVGFCHMLGVRMRYQYRLQGADGTWSSPTDVRTVNYAHLAPGSYQFEVKTLTSTGISSFKPATVSFLILPPIWRRWWFLGAVGLLVAGGAYGAHRYRLDRLKELLGVRDRIATDLHDEVGSSLARIAVLSEVVQRSLGGTHPESLGLLSSIADNARSLLDSMSDVVWAVDPKMDDMGSLIARIRSFVSDVLDARSVQWEFVTSPGLHRSRIDSDHRHQILLIYKEAINNVLRHTSCSALRLALSEVDGRLEGEICDNGQGFDTTDVRPGRGGRGLASMRARAERLGGSLTICSERGQGSRVAFNLPLGSHRRRTMRRRS